MPRDVPQDSGAAVLELAAPARGAPEMLYQARRLDECLAKLRQLHPRVCPRQVLGMRIGLAAGSLLSLELPRSDKRLLVLVETDGCFADGVSVATGCWLGRRTLRLVDYGKVAATAVDARSGRAFRLSPHPAARVRALSYAPDAPNRWHAQLAAYQIMPADQLLCMREVQLEIPLQLLVGHPGRITCSVCGEEILNGRGLDHAGDTRCRGCAGDRRYYRVMRQLA